MSELDSVNFCVGASAGIKYGAEYADVGNTSELLDNELVDNSSLMQDFESVPREQDEVLADVCADGVCPTNWKPERPQAA